MAHRVIFGKEVHWSPRRNWLSVGMMPRRSPFSPRAFLLGPFVIVWADQGEKRPEPSDMPEPRIVGPMDNIKIQGPGRIYVYGREDVAVYVRSTLAQPDPEDDE